MDVEILSRLQFAGTIMFHYLFPPLPIGQPAEESALRCCKALLAYNALCGGTWLEDIKLRRNDEFFLDSIGAERLLWAVVLMPLAAMAANQAGCFT